MYAIIDIGSNTIRLSFYKYKNKIQTLMNKKVVAGLVSYINEDKCLNDEGYTILRDTLNSFKYIIKKIKADKVHVFATASLRNIDNSSAIIKKIKKDLDIEIDLLSEEEEARFGYFGAIQSVTLLEGLYIDIGGGSTELVFFKDNKILFETSLKVGSLNMYNKFVGGLIPTKKEEEAIAAYVNKNLKTLDYKPTINIDNICGVGGSIRASLKISEKLHKNKNNHLKVASLDTLLDRPDIDAYIKNILKVKPDRIHTLTPGLIILKNIASFYNSKKVYVSDYGVREGYLLSKTRTNKDGK